MPERSYSTLPWRFARTHGNVAAEFPDDLAAGAAGRRQGIGIGDDGDGVEAVFAFRDGFEDRDALGAAGEAVAGVFDVAAGVDSSGFRAERRADAEIREGRVGILPASVAAAINASYSVMMCWRRPSGKVAYCAKTLRKRLAGNSQPAEVLLSELKSSDVTSTLC